MPTPLPRPLLLIGLRGSGKSTLGRLVAERLVADGLVAAFSDLDDAVLARLGHATVAEAWKTLGEPAFRAAETACLRERLPESLDDRTPPTVVALGGGTPTAPGAAELLGEARERGLVTIVYLRAQPETLRARLGAADANRPSLTGAGTLDEIDAVFAARDGLYQELATEIIEIDRGTTIDALVERLVAIMRG